MEQEVNPEVCDEVLYLTYKARIPKFCLRVMGA